MQLLHESLLDAFTTDTGEVDYSRKGGMSIAKQVRRPAWTALSLPIQAHQSPLSSTAKRVRPCLSPLFDPYRAP